MALAFWIALAMMALHEIDAVKRHEWRILPMTRFLPDQVGRRVFIWSHLPLAILAFWLIFLGPETVAAQAFSGFAVIHVGLHWLFRNHPKNEFSNVVSWVYIGGSGIAGLAHLIMVN